MAKQKVTKAALAVFVDLLSESCRANAAAAVNRRKKGKGISVKWSHHLPAVKAAFQIATGIDGEAAVAAAVKTEQAFYSPNGRFIDVSPYGVKEKPVSKGEQATLDLLARVRAIMAEQS